MNERARLLTASAVAVALLGAAQGYAQSPLKLKMASGVASTHYLDVEGSQYFIKMVADLTGGKLLFDNYPGEQLGKVDKIMSLAQSGVVDVGAQSLAYTADKTPLSGAAELPGLFTTSCQGTQAFRAASQPGKAIFENDFKPQGLRPLFAVTLAQSKLLTSRKAVRDVADFAGLKLRTAGGVAAILTTTLGAVPIHVTTPDVYQSFSRGTLDGVLLQFGGVKSYDLQTVAKYAIPNFGFGAIAYAWVISDKAWARIPDDDKAAIEKAGLATEKHLCEAIDKAESSEMERLKAGGMEMIELSDPVRNALQEKLGAVAVQWAKELNDRGKPGSAALQEFKAGLQSASASP